MDELRQVLEEMLKQMQEDKERQAQLLEMITQHKNESVNLLKWALGGVSGFLMVVVGYLWKSIQSQIDNLIKKESQDNEQRNKDRETYVDKLNNFKNEIISAIHEK